MDAHVNIRDHLSKINSNFGYLSNQPSIIVLAKNNGEWPNFPFFLKVFILVLSVCNSFQNILSLQTSILPSPSYHSPKQNGREITMFSLRQYGSQKLHHFLINWKIPLFSSPNNMLFHFLLMMRIYTLIWSQYKIWV